MTRQRTFALAAAVLLVLAVLTTLGLKLRVGNGAPPADLASDLARVDASGLSLAPQAAPAAGVVSAIERVPEGRTAEQPSEPRQRVARRAPRAVTQVAMRRAPAPQPTPVAVAPEPAPAPEPAAVPEPAPAPEPVITAARRPVQQQPTQQPPPGGWRTEAEIFGNAPFPITP